MSPIKSNRLLLPLMLAPVLAACGAAADVAAPVQASAVRAVTIVQPSANAQATRIRAIGRLESAAELRLSFKVAGVLAALHVEAGDTVSNGQILARLDSTETAAAVTRATESLAKAERDLKRAEEVFGRGLVSREVRDNAATARDIAAADLRSARFNQQFSTVVAPAAGRVKERLARVGEVIAAGQPVLTVSSESRGWLLRAQLADRDALQLALGDAAELRFDALPGQRFAAIVARIGGQADPATGTIEVEFGVAADDAPLRSGLLGKVDIAAHADSSVLSIPVAALLEAEGAEAEVFVLIDGRAQARRITLGRIAGDRVDVRAGLAAADSVIVGGASYVDDGEAVRVVRD
jgi:multidrug efflux system membrane fusion protein